MTAVSVDTATPQRTWQEANKEYLIRAMAPLRAALAGGRDVVAERRPAASDLAEIAAGMAAPPALDMLGDLFGLSAFERDLVLLCAGMELDSKLAAAVPAGGPTFSLALATLPEPHWSALAPTAPLRRWRLVEPASGAHALTTANLRLD
jgi:hypothetical protein